MSFYASLDFVKVGVASARDGGSGLAPALVSSRRCGDTAFVAAVAAGEPLPASFVAEFNRTFDALDLASVATAFDALDALAASRIGERRATFFARIDDRSRLATLKSNGFFAWQRRGPGLTPAPDGTFSYRPGDLLLLAGGPAAAALRDGIDGAGIVPVVGRSSSAAATAREFRDALEAAAPAGFDAVDAVVALRPVAREGVLIRRRFAMAAAASIVAHFILTSGLGWFLPQGSKEKGEPDQAATIVTISSAPHATPPPVLQSPTPQQAQTQPTQRQRTQPKPEPHVQRAPQAPAATRVPVMPPHISAALPAPRVALAPSHTTEHSAVSRFSAAQLAAIQQRLAQATRDLGHDDPTQVADAAPAAPKRYVMTTSSIHGGLTNGQGILRPLQSWRNGEYVYYYVSYEIVFSDGTYESGDVPWPIRYLPNEDPFKLPPHTIPLPPPLPDFVLPPGTHLGRALKPYFPEETGA
jgi:hypothetical protein